MNGLDLFSGIGGITKAMEGYVRPVAYCENDRYAQAVLMSRQATGDIPIAPIWDDVRTLRAEYLPPIDIIYGGFPCQDISVAGRGEGLAGKRSGLFFEIVRLIGEIRPRFVFLENVPAIRGRGADVVVAELARLGYDCRWDVLSAADVGANHRRERWWLLAHANGHRCGIGTEQSKSGCGIEGPADTCTNGETKPMADAARGGQSVRRRSPREAGQPARSREGVGDGWATLADATNSKVRARHGEIQERETELPVGPRNGRAYVADAHSPGCGERWWGESIPTQQHSAERGGETMADAAKKRFQNARQRSRIKQRTQSPGGDRAGHWWAIEPNVGRVAHGIPKRVDRLRALGNSVVPAQAREAFERLAGFKS